MSHVRVTLKTNIRNDFKYLLPFQGQSGAGSRRRGGEEGVRRELDAINLPEFEIVLYATRSATYGRDLSTPFIRCLPECG